MNVSRMVHPYLQKKIQLRRLHIVALSWCRGWLLSWRLASLFTMMEEGVQHVKESNTIFCSGTRGKLKLTLGYFPGGFAVRKSMNILLSVLIREAKSVPEWLGTLECPENLSCLCLCIDSVPPYSSSLLVKNV